MNLPYGGKFFRPTALTILVLNVLGAVLKNFVPMMVNKYIPLALIAIGVPLYMATSASIGDIGGWDFLTAIYGLIHSAGAVGLYVTVRETTSKPL